MGWNPYRTSRERATAIRLDLSQPLPRLRLDLDFMPSPSPEHPGLFIRDPYRFTDAMLIIPPLLVECLSFFDGRNTELDLRAALVRLTNDLEMGEIVENLTQTLSTAGFLETRTSHACETQRRAEFAAQTVREPAHAGSAYPADPGALRETMEQYLMARRLIGAGGTRRPFRHRRAARQPGGRMASTAPPTVCCARNTASRTFVILATSHYGQPEKFGLTRKNFRTPMGDAITDQRLVDWLAERGGDAVEMEDFCHSFEHTVELQVVFLQHVLGPGVRILPILVRSVRA